MYQSLIQTSNNTTDDYISHIIQGTDKKEKNNNFLHTYPNSTQIYYVRSFCLASHFKDAKLTDSYPPGSTNGKESTTMCVTAQYTEPQTL